ncbi:MAG: hypothetical protein Q9218_003119 [Villophora microphyllina]
MDVVNIVETGDLVVEVTETSKSIVVPTKTAKYRVSREVLKSVSQVMLGMLAGAYWKETGQHFVSLGEGFVAVTEVWLRVVHQAQPSYDLNFLQIWYLVQALDYYHVDLNLFRLWFAAWYDKFDVTRQHPSELLYPTWRFDHARGFARWTRNLAYGDTGHIVESNPTKLYQYHLPPRLIQQLNAAKGRLRTVLFRGLWGPCHHLLESKCSCKEKTLFDYQKHLYSIDVWPLETVFLKKSINEILLNLGKFNYEAPMSACGQCRQDYKGIVERVIAMVKEYFDGLCLDCLDRSKPKTGDVDLDYWRHDKLEEHEWVFGCRFKHKQPTWYFSFNGRKEERDRLVKRRTNERRTQYHAYQSAQSSFFDDDWI